MTVAAQSASVSLQPSTATLACQGLWTLAGISLLRNAIKKISWPSLPALAVDGSNITEMDSSGAWLFYKLLQILHKHYQKVELINFTVEHQELFQMIETEAKKFKGVPKIQYPDWIYRLGKRTVDQLKQFNAFLTFTGESTISALCVILDPRRLRWSAISSTIEITGFQALPIIALLSFMIGVVLTYQMGLQLRNYGANIFIVDLLGLAVLREFGPLLTAIMVAGRTGSAFTAQLGTMQLNEEIDALRTMAISPSELLVLPRLIGLFITLPLLTVWADIFSIFGGMVMAKSMLQVTWIDFLSRFQQVIALRSLIVGIGKTCVFALIIASIGCFQGLQVSGSATSVGRQTTKSVVQAIFFIIVVDALFSILFSTLHI